MARRWQFIECPSRGTTYWIWRQLSVDDMIHMQSEHIPDYGQAVTNAMQNGFRPRSDHWQVLTRRGVTHFQRGRPPVMIPAVDKPWPPASGLPRRNGSRVSGRLSRRRVEEKQ